MSTESDGPLGNEGSMPKEPKVLHEEEGKAEAETRAMQPAKPPRVKTPQERKIDWQDLHVQRGHDLLEAIIRERQKDLFRALVANVRRHGWRVPDLGAAAGFVGAGVLSGHPIVGAGLATVAAVGRSVWDTFRIRRNGKRGESREMTEIRLFMLRVAAQMPDKAYAIRVDEVPQVFEFQILWVRHAWRLVHYLRGYNARIEAAEQCLQAPARKQEEEDAATGILTLLQWIRPQLVHARDALEDLFVAEIERTKGSLYALNKLNERVMALNPFQDGNRDLPGLDWLPLPPDMLKPTRTELPDLYEKDVCAYESSMEQEAYTQQIHRDLADLESEYGHEVDEVIEGLRRKESERQEKIKADARAAADERWKGAQSHGPPESDEE